MEQARSAAPSLLSLDHRQSVDYTIGSKWQQAYATELADGSSHVFPIQYSMVERRWLNFWKVIDPPGTERVRVDQFHRMSRAVNYRGSCASCHTSQLKTGGAQRAADFGPHEHSVNCEVRHGPSGDHVVALRSGKEHRRSPEQPPVGFAEIDSERYPDICGRCHMQSNLFDLGKQGGVNYTGMSPTFVALYKGRPISEFFAKALQRDGRFRRTMFIGESPGLGVGGEVVRQGCAGRCGSKHRIRSASLARGHCLMR